MNPPLSGIRILSFEQYGAGPYGTQYLSDMGAQVIKIEPAGSAGDYARGLGPFFTTPDGDEATSDSSLFFQSFNRNKESITLDITSEAGRKVLDRLVASADAVANNLRGDVPEKIGITYDDLKSANPAIVCAHCSAYGRTGPRKNWPGYDYLMQAEAGYFQLCGEPDSTPTRFGLSVVDYMAGQTMAMGLLSGIISARTQGIGRDIDVNLFDTAVFNLSYVGNWALNSDYEPGRTARSAHPSLVPCQLYKTEDGWIYLMLNKADFWPVLCGLIGKEELVRDEKYHDYNARLKHRDELTVVLDEALSVASTDRWLEIFAGQIPAAPVLSPKQALANPYLQQRDCVQQLQDKQGNPVNLLASPIAAGVDRTADTAAPALGQHTDEILLSIGYQQHEIEQMREQKLI